MADALTVYRYDVTWMGYEVWIWLIVECNLAIICISVPVLRPLVRKYLPCLSMTTRHSKGLTSFASGSIFRRTSVRVECSDVQMPSSEEDKASRNMRFDEENGLDSNWTGNLQASEKPEIPYSGSQLGAHNSRMDESYYQHHDHFIGKAI
jgi:hypothetical protein